MTYIIPEIIELIPDELRMNYPIQTDRDVLDRYIRLALIYEKPKMIRYTFKTNDSLCQRILNLKYDGSTFKKDHIDEYTLRDLDILREKVIYIVYLYTKLNRYLKRSKTVIDSSFKLPEATRLFMINFLIDYQSLPNSYLLPDLPESLKDNLIKWAWLGHKELEHEIYLRLKENFDDFLENWYLYSGLELL